MNKQSYHHGDLRQALLAAAEAELSEKGVEAFTLRGVAKRAGVSHAAPAHHFKDTGALLTALAATAFERFAEVMRQRLRLAPDDARSRHVACGLGYIDFALANPALFKLMFGSQRPNAGDPELSRHGDEAFRILVDAVEGVCHADPLASEAGMTDIAASWAIVHGIATLLIAGRMPFLEPLFARDRDAVLSRLIGRALPDA